MMRLGIIGALLSVAACAATKDAPAIPASVQTGEGLILTALPQSGLPDGKCGLILWTLEQDRPAAILRLVAGEKAEISVNGVQTFLTLDEASGASGFGVFENQSFTSEQGFSAAVTFRFGLGFEGGSYVERGLVSVETEEGWRLVVPTAGIAGCRR